MLGPVAQIWLMCRRRTAHEPTAVKVNNHVPLRQFFPGWARRCPVARQVNDPILWQCERERPIGQYQYLHTRHLVKNCALAGPPDAAVSSVDRPYTGLGLWRKYDGDRLGNAAANQSEGRRKGTGRQRAQNFGLDQRDGELANATFAHVPHCLDHRHRSIPLDRVFALSDREIAQRGETRGSAGSYDLGLVAVGRDESAQGIGADGQRSSKEPSVLLTPGRDCRLEYIDDLVEVNKLVAELCGLEKRVQV